jgi:ATP-dependent Clp protease, protease subunit
MKKKNQETNEQVAPPVLVPPGKPTNRDIFVFGRLENEIVLPAIKRILKLNALDPNKPINMYINSAGGNGYNADAIIAVMSQIDAKVNTICLGHALSGACEILAAGTGERVAYEFSTLMFHQTLWEADGDITNLEIQAAQGQRFRQAQIEVLSRCTGQSKERIRKDIERDHYLTANDAVAYGIIDRVIGHKKRKSSGKNETSSSPDNHPAKASQISKAAKTQKSDSGTTASVKKKPHSRAKKTK